MRNMKKNKIVRYGSVVLAAAVLATGAWYTERETEDLSIPQVVEYIDTEDGSIVIPEEEVPLASKPTVKVKRTTKRKVKKSKLKKKAKKTKKTTKRSKKTKRVKKENSKKKVATDTTILTTVVAATRKDSNVKTTTTTVETTVKTTTTNKPKKSSGEAAAKNTAVSTAAQNTASDELKTVTDVTVRSMAPKADANVLTAFENLEFKIEINPASSYSGYFSVKSHNIILKKSSGDTIYHELGHFVGWLAGNVDTSSEFMAIYNQEKGALQSANYHYLTQNSAEYFAESYKDYILSPQKLQSARPQTYEFVKKAVSRISDARVANIKTAYMKAYWT